MTAGVRPMGILVGVGVAYAAGSLLSYQLFGASDIGVAYFPAAGVTAAALVLLPRRDWAWVLAGAAVAELTVDLSQGWTPTEALGFTVANLIEPLVGASLLYRWGPRLDLRRRVGLGRFVAGMVVAGPLVGGFLGAVALSRSGDAAFVSDLLHWWVGDGLGVLTVATPIVALAQVEARRELQPWRETAALLAALAVVSVALLWRSELQLGFLLTPVLVAAAFRSGVAGVAVSGAVVAVVANVATATGAGPFAATETLTSQQQLGITQLFLVAVLLPSLLFAVEIHERDLAQAAAGAERSARRRAELLTAVTTALEQADGDVERARAVVGLLVPALADRAGIVEATGDGTHVLASIHESDRPETGPALDLTIPFTEGDLEGALHVGRSAGRPDFTPDDRELFEAMAWRTGLALGHARLHADARRVALRLQRSLLADALVEVWDVSCGGHYVAGDDGLEVGGDWYDTLALPGGRLAAAVGDVVGRGLDAATTMGRMRTALTALATTGDDPGSVLDRFDRFARRVPGADCASCSYVVLDPASGELRHASAGHPPPLVLRADGTTSFLEDGRSPLLGLQDRGRATASTVLAPGDTVLLYTDGLVERIGEVLDQGLERLAAAARDLRHLDPEDLCVAVVERVNGEGARDDTAVVALRRDHDAAAVHSTRFDAAPTSLAAGRVVLREWLSDAGLDGDDRDVVVAAVGEAMANAVDHAYPDGRGEVELRLRRVDGRLDIVVRDDGRWRPAPMVTDRGRGTSIMEQLADDYERTSDDRGTAVRLSFDLRPAGATDHATDHPRAAARSGDDGAG